MKTISLLFLLLSISNSKSPMDTDFQLLTEGKLIKVFVEKAIYHIEGKENFLLKFRIENLSDKAIGIDLSDYWKVVYPNQWGLYQNPFREVIDERRMIVEPAFDKKALLAKFHKKELTVIQPNSYIDYYRDWNGSGEEVKQEDDLPYMIMTVDGQLLATDGKKSEKVYIGEEEELRAVVFSFPVEHKAVPEGAVIVAHH